MRKMSWMWMGVAAAFLLASLVVAKSVRGQEAQTKAAPLPPSLVADLEKIRDAALTDDYAWRQVAHLTQNIGPRISGSPQAAHAVEYVAEELRKLGLEVKLEKVKVPHWVRGEESGALTVFPGQAPGTTQKIVLAALGNSGATPAEGITADVVSVNNYRELNALGRARVAGRIVLFNEKFDKRMAAEGHALEAYSAAVEYRSNGAKAAAALGAVASLIRSVGNADYRLPHTGFSVPAGIPAGAVSAEDADLIADLTAQGRVEMHLVLTPQTLPEAESYNVIGDLKGSEHPEEIVIVSGHLDSWDLGTGAIDDGAGVAMAMETAQLFKKLGLRPKRTLRVVAWMDEESGGTGSQGYMVAHKAEIANYAGAVESDLGAGHPIGFRGKFSTAAVGTLREILEVLAKTGVTALENDSNPGEDISGMAQAGVPAFGPIQDERSYFNYHHTAADTLDKIDPRELSENAAAMAVLAFALADMEKTLPR
ncbi:MAG TPA: M20/M25/M40 family metallo-hydrolase [Candidatus Acidoferrum sp.]|jgi:Zn-dependent M28 family amino/carboxypeptidase